MEQSNQPKRSTISSLSPPDFVKINVIIIFLSLSSIPFREIQIPSVYWEASEQFKNWNLIRTQPNQEVETERDYFDTVIRRLNSAMFLYLSFFFEY